ncbi:MAG: hypothetical protein L3J61_05890, partial [Ghiorsea sp.]|nr:hypothetical protein [Ghiorsea sp.]
SYRSPNALIVNKGEIRFDNASEHIFKLEFEANYNDAEEILIDRLDADSYVRTSLLLYHYFSRLA